MAEQSASPMRGWIVTGAAVGINLILGTLYAWSVFAKAIVTEWHWTKTDAALPFTVATATFAISMVFAGRAQDRIGPRMVGLLGGLMFGVSLLASGFVTQPLPMAVTYGILGGLGLGLCYSVTTPSAIKWFAPSRKGLIAGLVVAGVGLAAVYASPLIQLLIRNNGIPRTFTIMGVGALLLIAIFALILNNPPAGYVPAGSAAKPGAPKPQTINADWSEMLGTVQFYLLWLMFVLAAAAGLMLIAHVAIIAKDQAGMTWGFLPVAVLAIFNTLGRIISGYVSDRIGRSRTMFLAFLLQAINMFFFIKYASPATLLFGTAFAGLCYGTIYTLFPAAVADYYGVRNLGVNYGLVFTAFGVAGIVGPILGGRVKDLTGTYGWSYVVSGLMLVVAAVLALIIKAPKPKEAPAAAAASPA